MAIAACGGDSSVGDDFFRLSDAVVQPEDGTVLVTVEVFTAWQPPAVLTGGGQPELRLAVDPEPDAPGVLVTTADAALPQLPAGSYHVRVPADALSPERELCLFNADVVTQCVAAPSP